MRGGHPGPPQGGVTTPKTEKICSGSCDISIESPWKALFKYVNWMLIWPLIWPSAAENDRKMTGKSFFYNCFFQGSMSTPNEIRSWFSTWTLVLTNIFILWTKIGRGRPVTPPPRGVTTPKSKKHVLGHVTYQSKAHEKLYSNMSIECSFDHSFDRQQLKMTGKSFFYNFFLRGACPHRMR